ncbi:MAG: hypothetical protein U0L97_01820 [Candidatus Saccharimonadaceae bacterium]|nr:hypothetical protein [Candidatus Saccharimonadaceae bacterium]
MVKKVYLNDEDNGIVISGDLSITAREEILDVLNRWKNMFLLGYPHHSAKRKISAKAGIIYKKWTDCPKVCITYLPVQRSNGDLVIKLLFSNTDKTPHTKEEIDYLISMFQQHVVEEIEALNL